MPTLWLRSSRQRATTKVRIPHSTGVNCRRISASVRSKPRRRSTIACPTGVSIPSPSRVRRLGQSSSATRPGRSRPEPRIRSSGPRGLQARSEGLRQPGQGREVLPCRVRAARADVPGGPGARERRGSSPSGPASMALLCPGPGTSWGEGFDSKASVLTRQASHRPDLAFGVQSLPGDSEDLALPVGHCGSPRSLIAGRSRRPKA